MVTPVEVVVVVGSRGVQGGQGRPGASRGVRGVLFTSQDYRITSKDYRWPGYVQANGGLGLGESGGVGLLVHNHRITGGLVASSQRGSWIRGVRRC